MSRRRQPLCAAALARKLRALSCEMFQAAVELEHAAGDDALTLSRAQELANASVTAKAWASELESKPINQAARP